MAIGTITLIAFGASAQFAKSFFVHRARVRDSQAVKAVFVSMSAKPATSTLIIRIPTNRTADTSVIVELCEVAEELVMVREQLTVATRRTGLQTD